MVAVKRELAISASSCARKSSFSGRVFISRETERALKNESGRRVTLEGGLIARERRARAVREDIEGN